MGQGGRVSGDSHSAPRPGSLSQRLWLHLGWTHVADFALENWGAPAFWKVLGAATEGVQGDGDDVGAVCTVPPRGSRHLNLHSPGDLRLGSRFAGKGFPRVSVKGP